MSIATTEEHLALADAARRFLAARCAAPVLRAAVDAEAERRPPFWDELAGLGWLGLHVDEDDGGQGYGFAELAVVLEELGRACVPGPFLPTVLAAAVLRGGRAPKLVAELAAGRLVGTVALGAPLAACDGEDGSLVVSGTVGPVLCGGIADVLVAPVQLADDERWCVLRAPAFRSTELASLDPTRRLAEITVDEVRVPRDDVLAGLERRHVEALAAALWAAECAGGAAWCLDTASSYASVREQFGRPIGQFQAVKHRCADMLTAVEQTRAVAWDAAAALDAGDGDLAASIAAAVAPDAFVRVAKDCIQVLGGVGFTWEHDAHLHLRRATATRQLLGAGARWRRDVALAGLRGASRDLAVTLPPEAEAVRAEVRAFAEEVAALPSEEQRAQVVDAGYFVPHWPRPWGRDAGPVEQLVVDDELRRFRIRRPHLDIGAWAAATIAAHGTPEQQDRWVRGTLLGTIRWCQLFSEPGAGSDLAALATSATRTEGGWLLNGQKVWTTFAREADYGICLARTDARAPKHLGITYFVVDMRAPGIEIRPLRELTGLSMFNEVFFDDVFVPDDAVVGAVNGGWPLARTTLANERVTMASGSSFGGGVQALLTLVQERLPGGGLEADALVLDQLGGLLAEAHTVALLGLRWAQRAVAGVRPGAEASVRKLLSAEHDQRTQEVGLTLLGPEGATTLGTAGQWTFGFLANRCLTIAGGTSEIQRNVIAERLLGLPRDPEPTTGG